MNRPDIARQVANEWSELGTWQRKTFGAWDSLFLGMNQRDLWLAHGGDWFSSLFVGGLPGLLCLACGCSLLLRLVPAWRHERELQPSPASWVWGVALGLLTPLILSLPVLYRVLDVWRAPSSTPYNVFYASVSMADAPQSYLVPPSWKFCFGAAGCFVVALWLASAWNTKRQGKTTLASRLRHIFSAPDDDMTRFDVSPLLSLAAVLAVTCLAMGGMLWFLITPVIAKEYSTLYDNAVLFLCIFIFLFGAPALWKLRDPQSRAFALVLARRLAWAQLIVLTLLWGLLWMTIAPAQKRFDAELRQRVQIGEMQLFRKQVGL